MVGYWLNVNSLIIIANFHTKEVIDKKEEFVISKNANWNPQIL